MTEQCQHLNTEECEIPLFILKKFEDMFGGTLSMWNTTLVYLELKYDVKQVRLLPYPVPKVHKSIFKK